MIKAICAPNLSSALDALKKLIIKNEADKKRTVIFCEDRLTLAAERIICSAVGGTFLSSVYTFARFLSSERGARGDVLSSQGSAMAIRAIIEENKPSLKLFQKLSSSAAAGAVYDTIALLYSSKISAGDLKKAALGGLLGNKLADVALIYGEYEKYLSESGKTDRNAYLRELPEVIKQNDKTKNADIVFLGFQSFTKCSSDCVKAAFSCAENTYGLFIGGAEAIYVNEAQAKFLKLSEEFTKADVIKLKSEGNPEAEVLRRSLFEPESYYSDKKLKTSSVCIFEASDEEEELEFVAASIKRLVTDCGERFGKISVMLPDVKGTERDLRRVFSQYRIPYYADRRHSLSEHAICSFIIDYLTCTLSGCAPSDTDAVISSPLFPESREDKDIFRNYALRLATFRGGVKRQPDEEILAATGFDYGAVQRIRERFLSGLKHLPANGGAGAYCGGIRRLMADFGIAEKLEELKEKFKDGYPAEAEFSGRVYEAVLNVLDEAESITGDKPLSLKEFIKILKSGFAAAEISLIPPKADAVFVGDLATCANTGTDVIFACSLTGDVPCASSDTAFLSDREITALSEINLDISPKIYEVNMRRRETTALNICAFRKMLYLSYPVRSGGEESAPGEIISYAQAVFSTPSGNGLKPVNLKRLEKTRKALAYYCSEKTPALKQLASTGDTLVLSSVYSVLEENGYKRNADAVLRPPEKFEISDGRELFVTYNSVTPTMLETYFTCPYKNFIQQGLKLQEREEGAVRPVDTGNFIHTVLQKIAPELNGFNKAEEVKLRAEEIAKNLMEIPPYSSMKNSLSGEYTAVGLIKEAGKISCGMYEQLANSKFKITGAEIKCEIPLCDGVKLYGRIDRVDGYEDMVRIIDYKTGAVDSSATKYYMGLKLQLPLYLTAASKDKRGVGAYYFPAAEEYREKVDGVFRLQGFMDGSDEVVSVSDTTLKPKEKSAYFDAYLGGGRIDKAMPADVFEDFITYSRLVARQGAEEMLEGNVQPSPASDACKYCKAGGSCAFQIGSDGEERGEKSVKCKDIADIVRKRRGDI